MKSGGVWFDNEVKLANYVFELTRLGAAYTVEESGDGWLVTVTGF